MKAKLLLIFILLIAAFLRFYQISLNPPSLTWDEAAWGYNAYSLGIDGRDEFGRYLPLDYLESFGDFKPVVYTYLTILPVKLFGLNEFSTRFPSAALGVLTVLVTYFLTKRIFRDSRKTSLSSTMVALTAAFFLAISPWHINLSRAAFEANVATLFLVSGTFFFLKAIQEKRYNIVISAIFFVLSVYTFNTSRIFAPLFIVFLGIGFRKELLKNKKYTFLAILVGVLLLLPTIKFLFSPQASLRFKEVNIFSDISVIHRTNQQIQNDNNSPISKIIHNRRLAYGVEYIRHYFDNLNPSFLFIKGDGNPKFSTQDVGQLYLWDFPFFIAGFLMLIRFRQGFWWIIPGWILLGIIPAGTARETPHALRIETIIPTFQILTAYGFAYLTRLMKQSYPRYAFFMILIIGILLMINTLYYLHGYYKHFPMQYSGEWQYGYKESIEFVKNNHDNYNAVYVTSELGRPYIYYLFYTKTPPSEFRESSVVKRDVFGFVNVESFGKFHFLKSLENVKKGQKALFIDKPEKIPASAKLLKEFKLLNGETILVAYTI